MLTKKTPETIAANLTIKGQGETVKLAVTYYNRRQSEIRKAVEGGENAVLFLIKEWDAEFELSTAGLEEMEDARPGVIQAVIEGFHVARQAELVKN